MYLAQSTNWGHFPDQIGGGGGGWVLEARPGTEFPLSPQLRNLAERD